VLIPLWMGVPVVTMKQNYSGHRYGSAVVENSGFPEWVAKSKEEYLLIIERLVNNPQQLEALSKRLRDSLATSSICDGKSLALNIEGAYRKVWKMWCGNKTNG
ncbi:MAG: hypothetical protein HQL70_06525, partial [Magnetococcales bacterium]|nr:hypothetical protein [Magnetococcales bacterium]